MSNLAEFFDASARGDADALRRLLSSDPTLARAANSPAPHEGWTGLHTAAKSGHVGAVRVLLESGADPNAREAGDRTSPLHWAAAHAHVDVVRALIDAGADVNGFGDVHELDVIGWATVFGSREHGSKSLDATRQEVVSLLLARGARHHIFSAMAVGALDLIREVVEQNPKALDRRLSRFEGRQTPLHFAIDRQRYDILDLLIALRADLEAEDGRGQTALAVAMLRGDRDAIDRLHAAGARAPTVIDSASTQSAMEAVASSVNKVVPMIYVTDVARSLAWYTSIGFTELARYEADGVVNFGMVSLGRGELMLNMHGKAGAQTASVWFYTDQVDAIYQLLKSRQLAAAQSRLTGAPDEHEGIQFEQDLEDMFYGARQFCIRDPDGYELYFIQSIES
jgi:ankyrin repeat protein